MKPHQLSVLLLILGFLPIAGAEPACTAPAVEARCGETFSITLDSNPTTGYQWRLAGQFPARKLRLVKSSYRRPSGRLVGAGGREIWTFEALAAGRATLRFEYIRPWEKDVPPARTRTFEVAIAARQD